MVNTLLRFAAGCRAADLRVSTAEVLEAVEQLQYIDPSHEAEFKQLLQANFVKTHRDLPRFERLYHLFFHDLTEISGEEPASSVRRKALDILEALQAESENNGTEIDPVDRALMDFLGGDPRAYLATLQATHQPEQERQTPLRSNLGELSNRLSIMLKINRLRSRSLELVKETLVADPVGRREVEDFFSRLLGRADDLLRHEPRPDNAGLREVKNSSNRYRCLGEKPLANLTPAEIRDMHETTEGLVRKLKDVVSRRMAVHKKGQPDIKKTLRRANRFQGVPLDICYRYRPPRKAKIVTLCDVSGSVWSAARFMLHLLYSLQDCFAGVKSFIFVAGVADVSSFFEEHDCSTAIEKVLHQTDLNYEAPTDYGETFRCFRKHHFSELNSRTTLIIIGDGRCNYMNPRVDILEEMRYKCRRIIWLNPEPMNTWHTGDSEMNEFRRYCHEIRPCRNLNQLAAFIEELVL